MKIAKNLASLIAAGSLAILFPCVARGESIEEFLRVFHGNPARMMERLPSVVDEKGEAHPQGFINREQLAARFPNADLFPASESSEEGNDIPERLLDPGSVMIRSLPALEGAGLTMAEARSKPWADSYWPTYKGQVANRYADAGFPNSKE